MIRDFWGIGQETLYDEVQVLKQKVEPVTWQAVERILRIGNIGLHMKEDTARIIETDEDEAPRLIYLLEILFANWYVSRHEAQRHLKKIARLGENKKNGSGEPQNGELHPDFDKEARPQ